MTRFIISWFILLPPLAATSPATAAQTQPARSAADAWAGYHSHKSLTEALRAIAQGADSVAMLTSLAKTSGGRDVWLLTIAASGDRPPEDRPALLIVGGVDADRPASCEVALRMARRLLEAARLQLDGPEASLLADRTLYFVPCLNPDGIEAFFAAVKFETRLNDRPLDDDRDDAVNEDGPNDLNGDGWITVMRAPDPEGVWMIDEDEPRLMKKADAAKGETGVYKLWLEGIDDDNDGEINEDGPGGVDDDRNWPHLYESGAPHVGAHQISEPETRALAEFVVEHPRIAAAIVFGRHDNIVKVPKGKQRGPDGQSYRDLHPDDIAYYEHISEMFRDATGLKRSSGADPAGALYAWLYSQRAILTVATDVWSRPEPEKPASQPATAPAKGEPNGAKGGKPPAGGSAAAPKRPGGRPGGRGAGKDDNDDAPDPLAAYVAAGDEARQWLAYSDQQRGGAGFVEWVRVSHPTLGSVEVGGFAPYFRTTPPADELDSLAAKQSSFVIALSDLLPRPRFGDAVCTLVGADVWKIDLTLVNDAYLPTHTAIARHTEQPPWAVRPLVEPERIVGGRRLERVPNIPGSGGQAELHWLIRGSAGSTVRFRAFNRVWGEITTDVTLTDGKPQEVAE